jgi:hypothetical protein
MSDCVLCPVGTYNPFNGKSFCKKCPEPNFVFSCDSGSSNFQIINDRYFVQLTNNSILITECLSAEACDSFDSQITNCNIGYTGFGCRQCQFGFYFSNNRCLECGSGGISLLGIVIIVFIFAACALLVMVPSIKMSSSMKIIVFPIQLVTLLPKLSSQIPSNLDWIFRISSFSNLDVQLFAAECSPSVDYWIAWRLQLLVPVFILIPLALIYITDKTCYILKLKQAPDTNRYIYCAISFLHAAYFPILNHLFEPVVCKQVLDGELVISRRSSVLCSGKDWKASIGIVFILGSFYVLVLPLLFFGYIKRAKDVRKLEATAGILIIHYKEKFAWWLVCVLLKKFLIVCLPSLLSVNSSVHILLTFIVLLFFLVIDLLVKPFVHQLKSQVSLMYVFYFPRLTITRTTVYFLILLLSLFVFESTSAAEWETIFFSILFSFFFILLVLTPPAKSIIKIASIVFSKKRPLQRQNVLNRKK